MCPPSGQRTHPLVGVKSVRPGKELRLIREQFTRRIPCDNVTFQSAFWRTPMPAPYTDCASISAEDIASAVLDQIPQITWANVRTNLLKNPYASLYDGGTYPNFEGDRVITAVMDRVATGHSLTRPVSVRQNQACGIVGPQAKYGQTTFTSYADVLRGESPLVCINKARQTVVDGYEMATKALRNANKDIIMAEQRVRLVDNSGLKYVARTDSTIPASLNGGENVQAADWPNLLPNAAMSFEALLKLAEMLRYVYGLNIETFGEGDNGSFRVIVGYEQTNRFRNEANVLADFRAATTGSYNDAKNELWQYQFNPLYRGLQIGVDPQPLRFSNLSADGSPQFIEPLIESTDVDGGTGKNVVNPEWVAAPYEVGIIASKSTFQWKVPQSLTSIGEMKWPAQFSTGALQWVDGAYIPCNKYNEFGQFIWGLNYMVTPQVPHGIIAFTYTRCQSDLGLSACSNISTGGESLPVD